MKNIMIVAGEASGDLHGSEIARRLQETDPTIRCTGMGSHRMQNAGVELLVDCDNIAVVGLIEVLTHWGEIKAALRTLERHIAQNPPDLLLLIDYQEFNLRLAASAKARGIKVLFYVSPQIWAWRENRIRKFAERIDMMAVIFPFEVPYFEKAGIPVRYVGHPLTREVKPEMDREAARRHFGLEPGVPLVALLPGSRRAEIRRLLPVLLDTSRIISRSVPQTRYILTVANQRARREIDRILNRRDVGKTVIVVDEKTYDAVHTCDAAVVASGTATLEVALLGVPMAIVYRVTALSYAILKRLIRIPNVGLANIVAGEQVAPEYIQRAAKAEKIAAEIVRLLSDRDYHANRVKRLNTVRQRLGESDGIQGIVDLALEILGQNTQ